MTRNTTPPKPVGVPPTPGGSVPATVLTPSQGPVDPPARLLALHGAEQTYAWGSRTAIPDLLGRPPADGPVAELWLGTHPVAPALVEADGARHPAADLVGPLPFLLKVLAADKALSLQVHPDLDQAAAGFEADEAAGIAVDDPRRRYRDRNHKPELIVALTPFRALAGVRDPARTLAVVARFDLPALEAAFRPLAGDPATGATAVLRILLTMSPAPAAALVRELVTAAARHSRVSSGGADDLARAADLVGLLAAAHPGDIGIAAALLLNDVTLRPGEGLFQPARMLHAYVSGLGIEIMATSDNVLRGGLTPKHIDVDELLRLVDPTPSGAPVLTPRTISASPGGLVRGWDVPVADFALAEAICTGGGAVPVGRPTVLLAVDGELTIEAATAGGDGAPTDPLTLRRGAAALVTGPADVTVRGRGRLFLAGRGG